MDEYWILIGISSLVLTILCVLTCKQLCNTDIYERTRLHNVIWVACVNIIGIILNALTYVSYMYPHLTLFLGLNVKILTYIFEAFAMIITFYMLELMVLSIMNRLYEQLNIQPPKFIKHLFYGIQILIVVMVFLCYSFVYLFGSIIWMHIFHITLGIIIFIEAIFVLRSLVQLLNILKTIHSLTDMTRIIAAKRAITIAVTVTVLIMIVCHVDIWITIYILVKQSQTTFDLSLNNAIFHSVFIILIVMSLLLWIYRKYECCYIGIDSVCMVYGCGDFWSFICGCFCTDSMDDVAVNQKQIEKNWKIQNMFAQNPKKQTNKQHQVRLLQQDSQEKTDENR
eukprot:304157_1